MTYELMGSADALEAFAIVPATGQILSQKKLDHEVKPTYDIDRSRPLTRLVTTTPSI